MKEKFSNHVPLGMLAPSWFTTRAWCPAPQGVPDIDQRAAERMGGVGSPGQLGQMVKCAPRFCTLRVKLPGSCPSWMNGHPLMGANRIAG